VKKNDETYIQIYLCSFLRKLQFLDHRFIFYSIPNGGTRNAREAMNLKMSGLLPGAPDLCLVYLGHTHYVELKKHKGTLSEAQKDFIAKARTMGHKVTVIYADTPDEAITAITPIMEEIGYQKPNISSIASSVLSSIIG